MNPITALRNRLAKRDLPTRRDPVLSAISNARDAIEGLHTALTDVHQAASEAMLSAQDRLDFHRFEVDRHVEVLADLDELHNQTTDLRSSLLQATGAMPQERHFSDTLGQTVVDTSTPLSEAIAKQVEADMPVAPFEEQC